MVNNAPIVVEDRKLKENLEDIGESNVSHMHT